MLWVLDVMDIKKRRKTMRKILFRVTILAWLGLIGMSAKMPTAEAQKNSNLPVTSTIANTDASGTLQFQIQSDDLGSYKNTKAVQSVIQPIGDWVLDTNYSSLSTRSVYLDFSQPVNGTGPNGTPSAPFASALVRARLITQCPTYGNSMLSLSGGETAQCGLVIGFDYGTTRYRLTMNPINYATDFVNVSCSSVGTNGQCNAWRIVPAATSGENVAKLLLLTTVRGKIVATDQGDFYMSFSIIVTNP